MRARATRQVAMLSTHLAKIITCHLEPTLLSLQIRLPCQGRPLAKLKPARNTARRSSTSTARYKDPPPHHRCHTTPAPPSSNTHLAGVRPFTRERAQHPSEEELVFRFFPKT